MKKIQLFGSTLTLVAALSLASCANDEPLNGGNGNAGGQTAGAALTFNASYGDEIADDATKRTYYGAPNGTSIHVYWSNDDRIKIYSPAANSQGAQTGIYTVGTVGDDQVAALFEYLDAETQATTALGTDGLKQAIRPHSSGAQSFYAYYPSTTAVDADGVATYTLPKDQSTASVTAANAVADADGDISPFAASVAAIEDLPVEGLTNIDFTFYDIMNVLRLQVNNFQEYAITGITITSGDEGHPYVSGEVKVTPTATNTFTTAVSTTGTTVVDAKQVIATPEVAAQKEEEQFYSFYLAPQEYAGITITITYIDQWDRHQEWSGTTQAFARGAVKDVVVNIDECECNPTGGIETARTGENSVDMGIWVVSNTDLDGIRTEWISNGIVAWDINVATGKAALSSTIDPASKSGAKRLYFATGNMHVPVCATTANLEAGNWGVIAPITKDDVSSAAGNGGNNIPITNLTYYGSNALNGGFYGWGDPLGDMTLAGYDDNNAYPLSTGAYAYPGGTRPQHISSSKWDIATHQLGEAWRLPTVVEWAFLLETSNAMRASGGNSYTSTVGYISGYVNAANIHTISADKLPWQNADDNKRGYLITSTTTSNSIFLPALGFRNGSVVNRRGTIGRYSSGAFCNASLVRYLEFQDDGWSVTNDERYFGRSVRPVSEL